jgi:two-component system LytT family sensor kinase
MVFRATWRDPILINTVGHWAGVLLFSVTIFLLFRNWRIHGIRSVKLPLAAAGLALGWNLGALFVLGWPDANPRWLAAVITASFSMLTMLPAVLLQVVTQGRHRVITAIGYIISATAGVLHVAELISIDRGLHHTALWLVVVGFGLLSVATALIDWADPSEQDRPHYVSLVCLILFTSSFVHFGYQHTASPWAAEITWHHIGLPVALIVLLKDYRFLLLDAFSRFILNFGLAVAYIAIVLGITIRLRLWELVRSNMFASGGLLVALCLSLILFAYGRNGVQAWMNKAIFRRQNLDLCRRQIELAALASQSEEDLLARCAQHIAMYLRTDEFAISKPLSETLVLNTSLVSGELVQGHATQKPFRPEAKIPLRFSTGNNRYLYLGRRRGGQRYWSDDLSDMAQLGAAIVEQSERFRAEELKRLVNQAELRALQAQINPHFLFNALNTLYGTIDRGSVEARTMVLNLAEIFRYFLQGERAYISLAEELRIVEAYLQIEGLRLGDRLSSELIVTEKSRSAMIPILTIQPLVENAVKHGVAPKAGPCRVIVRAEEVPAGFRISVQDTGVGFAKKRTQSRPGMGLGLDNVRRRLALSYGVSTDFQIETDENGTKVSFVVPHPTTEHLAAMQHSRVPA